MRAVLVVALALLGGCVRKPEAEPLWVGHLAPLAGLNKERGEDAVRAMKLLLEGRKAEGKTLGGREVAVRHVGAEDKVTARAEATRLLAVNRVLGLLVGPAAGEADEVVTTARAHDAPVVVLEQDPGVEGGALAKFLLTKVKRTEAVVEREPDDRASGRFADAFTSAWRGGGGKVVPAAGPGVVRLRAKRPVTAEVDGDVYSVTVYPPSAGLPEAARGWAARYEERYGRPPTADALLAHDGLGIFLSGLEDGQPSRQTLLESVSKRKSYEGLTGTLRHSDGRWRWPLFLVRQRAGKAEVVEAIPAPEG